MFLFIFYLLLFIFWIFVFVLIHFHNVLTCFEEYCYAEIAEDNSCHKSCEEQVLVNSPLKNLVEEDNFVEEVQTSVVEEVQTNEPTGILIILWFSILIHFNVLIVF